MNTTLIDRCDVFQFTKTNNEEIKIIKTKSKLPKK